MADFSTFQYGGVSYPLSTNTGKSLLRDADPSLFYALDYFEAVLNTHMGARFAAECAISGLTFGGQAILNAVSYKIPLDPLPFLQEEQFKFPLLAVYRKSDKYSYKTVNWSQAVSKWGVAYILPPCTPGQAEQVIPILHAVPIILGNRIEQGFDPAYLNGAKVWSKAYASLQDIELTEASFGAYPGIRDMEFPAWTAEMIVSERQMPETDFVKLAGVDHATDLTNKDGTVVPDFTDFKSDIVKPGPATG